MRRSALLALLALAGALCVVPAAAQAAAPQVGAAWTTEVRAASATFRGEVNPEGSNITTCRFEYVTDAHFQAEGFTAAALATCEPSPGSGTGFVTVSKHVSALKSATTYHYRLVASSSEGTETLETNPAGRPLAFTTQGIGAAFSLPDSRGWELVSPAEKNGGAVQGPEENHGGGVLQAAATGPGGITYTSASSFGGYSAQGAPQGSQYISTRSAGGWSTQNITTPMLSGSYGNDPNGVPYQLFSGDLARGLLLNGVHCRGEGSGCPVANPPLPGSGAPEGFQDYYLRNDEAGSFAALLTEANKGPLALSATQFNLSFAGSSPDLAHVILSTCAKLTADASEVAGSEGCDPTKPNLYEWSGGGLALVNTAPGAKLAAQGGAISTDGSRVYFTEAGKLWLHEGASAPHELALGGEFQTATPSGAFAFYTKAQHLFRYDATTHAVATDLTPAGGVVGVIGSSAGGSAVYFQTTSGLKLWQSPATITQVASGGETAQASDYPPTTGTARVSADGETLLFLSKESLTGYDNHDQTTGLPDSEVFLWSSAGGGPTCLSCNPTGERPLGPSTIPGAYSNGTEAAAGPGEIVTDSYKSRNLSANGQRVFFDSADALVALDTDRASDAYQWEAQGQGSCAKPGGCVGLLSSGTGSEGASFIDASESGADAYFLTSASLHGSAGMAVTPEGNIDPGSADVYDARIGGGFAEPKQPIPCEGDACAPLPPEPEDPSVGTLVPGPGNPPVHFPKTPCPKGTHRVTSHGKSRCVKSAKRKPRHHKRSAAHRRPGVRR